MDPSKRNRSQRERKNFQQALQELKAVRLQKRIIQQQIEALERGDADPRPTSKVVSPHDDLLDSSSEGSDDQQDKFVDLTVESDDEYSLHEPNPSAFSVVHRPIPARPQKPHRVSLPQQQPPSDPAPQLNQYFSVPNFEGLAGESSQKTNQADRSTIEHELKMEMDALLQNVDSGSNLQPDPSLEASPATSVPVAASLAPPTVPDASLPLEYLRQIEDETFQKMKEDVNMIIRQGESGSLSRKRDEPTSGSSTSEDREAKAPKLSLGALNQLSSHALLVLEETARLRASNAALELSLTQQIKEQVAVQQAAAEQLALSNILQGLHQQASLQQPQQDTMGQLLSLLQVAPVPGGEAELPALLQQVCDTIQKEHLELQKKKLS